MAIEFKYGKVTLENSNIGEDEPVIVFRAKDKTLPALLGYYWSLCHNEGSPKEHLDRINSTREKITEWQLANPVKIPD